MPLAELSVTLLWILFIRDKVFWDLTSSSTTRDIVKITVLIVRRSLVPPLFWTGFSIDP